MAYREPTFDEQRLLNCLAKAAPELSGGCDWTKTVLVESMNDGGMGSLRITRLDLLQSEHRRIRIAAEIVFMDADGVDVIASLYVDEEGEPQELDMWKVTYAPLIRIPDSLPPARRPNPNGKD